MFALATSWLRPANSRGGVGARKAGLEPMHASVWLLIYLAVSSSPCLLLLVFGEGPNFAAFSYLLLPSSLLQESSLSCRDLFPPLPSHCLSCPTTKKGRVPGQNPGRGLATPSSKPQVLLPGGLNCSKIHHHLTLTHPWTGGPWLLRRSSLSLVVSIVLLFFLFPHTLFCKSRNEGRKRVPHMHACPLFTPTFLLPPPPGPHP